MNRIKNYNDYADYVRSEVLKGNRPHNKNELARWRRRGCEDYYEFHHVIPKCCGGDDTEYNLIPLTAREHFLAHYLLLSIYKDTEFEYSLLCAFNIIVQTSKDILVKRRINSKNISKLIEEKHRQQVGRKLGEDFCKKQKYIQSHRSDEWKSNISKSKLGKMNGMSHSKWVNDGKTSKVVDISELENYLSSGWFIGRVSTDMPSTRKKIKCSNGKIYISAVEAAKDTGVSASSICFYLKGKTKSLRNGLHYEYYNRD